MPPSVANEGWCLWGEPDHWAYAGNKYLQPVPVGKTRTMDQGQLLVLVGYRLAGWISDVKKEGHQRNNGWIREVLDRHRAPGLSIWLASEFKPPRNR